MDGDVRPQLFAVGKRCAAHLALEQALRVLHRDLGELVQWTGVDHLLLDDVFLLDLNLAADKRCIYNLLFYLLFFGCFVLGYDHAAFDYPNNFAARTNYVAAGLQAVVALFGVAIVCCLHLNNKQ